MNKEKRAKRAKVKALKNKAKQRVKGGPAMTFKPHDLKSAKIGIIMKDSCGI